LNPTLLIIDDEKTIRSSLSYFFRDKGCEVYEAGSVSEGLTLAKNVMPDLVILDYKLPDGSGIEALDGIKALDPGSVVIMLTAFASIPAAVEAIRAGAFDYMTKPVDMDAIELAADRAFEVQRLRKENQLLKEMRAVDAGADIIGNSPEVHKLQLMINLLAENPGTTVLIEGESGTGKEVAARAIHKLSVRRDRPFVDVNCASLSETLLESELFGHERGAFTDAKVMKRGLMEVADGGTLLLDEIGELSPRLQPKLLRVIETKTFRRVGGTRDIKSDVRFLAATNRNLSELVEAREFREDLYYRLRVMPLYIPPLRERGQDILVLARHFISTTDIGVRKKLRDFSPECEKYLMTYRWPGNIRELKNVMERAVILSPEPLITEGYLPRELTSGNAMETRQAGPGLPLTLEEMEKRHVSDVMDRAGGNQSQAARLLGISRSTLINKLKKFGLL